MSQGTDEFYLFRNRVLSSQDHLAAYTEAIVVFENPICRSQIQLHDDYMLSAVSVIYRSGYMGEVILFSFVTLNTREINSRFSAVERYAVGIDEISFDIRIG